MNALTDPAYKSIIARRDRRFDGRFYFGVTTTGIYCRPVCPAKPKPDNIRIFKSATEAEATGFRACLRCHPDLAPGSKFLDGTINTVSRALRLIGDASETELNVPALAASLGMTDRHLRRLFDEHLGASPIDILITRRLHFAKQVIQESSSSMTDVAFAAGFQSVRRFNEAFKSRYHRSPSDFRKNHAAADDALTLKIPIHLPYDWASMLSYLRRHETFGLERVTDDAFTRFVPFGKTIGSVRVTRATGADHLRAAFNNTPLAEVRGILGRLKNLFDTDHNPLHLPVLKEFSPDGIRVPGSFEPFESAVTAILSQLVSSEQSRVKVRKLIEAFGRKVGDQGDFAVWEFPRPAVLAKAEIEIIGVPRARGDAVRALSHAVHSGAIDFKSHADVAATVDKLLAMRGIGPWTAKVIAMRCLGDADAFPEFDLIIQRALKKKLAVPAAWASSRAYLAHMLWRDHGEALSKLKKRKKP